VEVPLDIEVGHAGSTIAMPHYRRRVVEPGPGVRRFYDALVSEIDEDVQAELTALRATIDNIDAAVVHMLAERFKATQRVGRLKAEHQLPPADPAREQDQITRLRELAASANLDPVFAEKFLGFVIAEVIRHHEVIART